MLLDKMRLRAIVAATIGNAFEWYDFIVFGFLSVIIAKQFFPSSNPTMSLLLTTGTFGVSFLVRPIGGIILGIYADKAGRKPALTLVIALMTIAAAIMAFTPTYESIGIAAPLIVLFSRLLQGFSAGGEFGSATAMLVEYAPPGRRGFYGSWQFFGQFAAAVVSALMGALVTGELGAGALANWGWRIPFMFGVLIGPVGFYIRTKIDEPEVYTQAVQHTSEQAAGPLRAACTRYLPELSIAFGLVVFGAIAQYVLNLYLPIYSVQELKLPLDTPFIVLLVTGVVRMVLMPLFGDLSDRVGRKPVMGAAMALYVVTLYPLFLWVVMAPSLWRLLIVEIAFSVLMAASLGPSATALAELFPTWLRGTGLSLAYNVANTLFGGFTPFILTWLIASTGNKMIPAYYVIGGSVIGLLALWPMKDGAREASLEAPASPTLASLGR